MNSASSAPIVSPTGKKGAAPAPASNKIGAVGDIAALPVAGKDKATSLTEITVVDAPPVEAPTREPLPRSLLAQAIETASDEQGWAHLGQVGSYLNKLRPDFDPRLHGHRKLSDLIRAYPKLFELQERGEGAAKAVFVRIRE